MSSSSPRRLMPISRPTPTVAAAVRSSSPKRPMTGRTRLNPTTPTMRRRSPSSSALAPDCANQYSAEAGDYWLRIADGTGTLARLVARAQRGDGRDPDLPGKHDLPPRRLGDTGGVLVGEQRRLVGRRRDEGRPRVPTSTHRSPGTTGCASPMPPGSTSTSCSNSTTPLRTARCTRVPRCVCRPVPAVRRRRPPLLRRPRAVDDLRAPVPATTAAPAPPRRRQPPNLRRPPRTRPRCRRRRRPPARSNRSSATCGLTTSRNRPCASPGGRATTTRGRRTHCCSGLFQIYYEVHAGWLADTGRQIGRRPLRPAHQCHGGVRLVPAFR